MAPVSSMLTAQGDLGYFYDRISSQILVPTSPSMRGT